MNLTIKPLTQELTSEYLDYFDNRAFADDSEPCYCSWPTQTTEEKDQMMSEFGSNVKDTLRRYAVKMLNKRRISGYMAFDDGTSVGWVNAGDMSSYPVARWSHIPDFARENAIGRTISIVCFSVAPEYRGIGISTALIERIISDAKEYGYAAVEGYAHKHDGRDDSIDSRGSAHLYEKLGFVPVAERDDVVVMRKVL